MGEEKTTATVLVVGGGISGISTAIEAAEAGYSVVLVEKNPYLGGRVAQLNQYFPKLCPPYCGLEINFRRMKQSSNVRFFTMAEVESVSGQAGDFEVTIKISPRFVNEKCTCCGKCAEVCEMEIDNPFNFGLDKIKAAYLPHELAYPMRYVLDPALVGSDEAQRVKEACPFEAVDLDMQPQTFTLSVGSIVWAAGWSPNDPSKIEPYKFEESSNVITNVQMERLAASSGPTGGRIVRPSDGQAPESVAFVQCAGSRDEDYLPYCSGGVCCMASLKQTRYIREQYPEARMTVCFIDIRAMERLEDFYVKVQADDKVTFIKAKITSLTQDPGTGEVTLEGQNPETGQAVTVKADLAVLATGMVPNTAADKIPLEADYDAYGFLPNDTGVPGLTAVGTAKRPNDVSSCVQSGTAGALKAIHSIVGR